MNGVAGQYTFDKLCMNPDNVSRYPISESDEMTGVLEKSCATGFYGRGAGMCHKEYQTLAHYTPDVLSACLAVKKMYGDEAKFDSLHPERATDWSFSSGQGAGTTAPEIHGDGEYGCVANQSSEILAAYWSVGSSSINYSIVPETLYCGWLDVRTGRVVGRLDKTIENKGATNVSRRLQDCFAELKAKMPSLSNYR